MGALIPGRGDHATQTNLFAKFVLNFSTKLSHGVGGNENLVFQNLRRAGNVGDHTGEVLVCIVGEHQLKTIFSL